MRSGRGSSASSALRLPALGRRDCHGGIQDRLKLIFIRSQINVPCKVQVLNELADWRAISEPFSRGRNLTTPDLNELKGLRQVGLRTQGASRKTPCIRGAPSPFDGAGSSLCQQRTWQPEAFPGRLSRVFYPPFLDASNSRKAEICSPVREGL